MMWHAFMSVGVRHALGALSGPKTGTFHLVALGKISPNVGKQSGDSRGIGQESDGKQTKTRAKATMSSHVSQGISLLGPSEVRFGAGLETHLAFGAGLQHRRAARPVFFLCSQLLFFQLAFGLGKS